MALCTDRIPKIKLDPITQGDSFYCLLEIERTGFNWAGATLTSHIKRSQLDSNPFAVIGVRVLSQSTTFWTVELFSDNTQGWAGTMYGDIRVVYPNGTPKIWLKYTLPVEIDITRSLGVVPPNPTPTAPLVETNDYLTIAQANHGFAPGNGIAFNGTQWIKSRAVAGELDNGLCVGVVDADHFVRACASTCYTLSQPHGYPLNTVLFVGPVAGQLTGDQNLIPAANQSPNLLRLGVAECPSANTIIYRPQFEPK